jgi:aminoglycoside 2''-phosphotransferase
LKVPGGSPGQWRQRYQDLYTWVQERAFPLLAAPAQAKTAALCESFLTNDANFQFRPVLIHGDLAGEHIFCAADTGTVAGVIDWEDATIGDPALDFVGLLCDAGPDFTRQVLAGYRGELDDAVEQRMRFYSRIGPLYEIQFGLATGDKAHLDQGLELLRSELQSV